MIRFPAAIVRDCDQLSRRRLRRIMHQDQKLSIRTAICEKPLLCGNRTEYTHPSFAPSRSCRTTPNTILRVPTHLMRVPKLRREHPFGCDWCATGFPLVYIVWQFRHPSPGMEARIEEGGEGPVWNGLRKSTNGQPCPIS